MEVLADVNVPEEYVSALRGDGHEIVYSREVSELGPEATDEYIVRYAEAEEYALLSTDVSDFANRDASVPVLVAPQDMTGGEVQTAVARLEALPLDAEKTDPIWLTAL
jgi:predicted nuclease of predicted toxin-antitoxin system